jgi:hypothetical protein
VKRALKSDREPIQCSDWPTAVRAISTEQGLKLDKEWASLLLKKEPILKVVAGLVDGSITGLVVILSAFFGRFGNENGCCSLRF